MCSPRVHQPLLPLPPCPGLAKKLLVIHLEYITTFERLLLTVACYVGVAFFYAAIYLSEIDRLPATEGGPLYLFVGCLQHIDK